MNRNRTYHLVGLGGQAVLLALPEGERGPSVSVGKAESQTESYRLGFLR